LHLATFYEAQNSINGRGNDGRVRLSRMVLGQFLQVY